MDNSLASTGYVWTKFNFAHISFIWKRQFYTFFENLYAIPNVKIGQQQLKLSTGPFFGTAIDWSNGLEPKFWVQSWAFPYKTRKLAFNVKLTLALYITLQVSCFSWPFLDWNTWECLESFIVFNDANSFLNEQF